MSASSRFELGVILGNATRSLLKLQTTLNGYLRGYVYGDMGLSWRDVEFVAKVVSVKGICAAGHNLGDEFVINTHKTGGICGFVYHDLFPVLMAAVMGGSIPWWESADEGTYECSDKKNLVTFKLTKSAK